MQRWFVVSALIGCGNVRSTPPEDAALPVEDSPVAPMDTPPDDPGCQDRVLYAGGTTAESQGWAVVQQAPATLTDGPDFVSLVTTQGASTSGQLLLNYPGAFNASEPFRLEVEILVQSVNPHNLFDAGAGIMGSYSGGFGNGTDRGQMIYLDGGAIGWADDTQTFAATITNNAFHTVLLAVDGPNGNASVSLDGVAALTRSNFVYNGSIAIGDQTNDPNVDGAMRIRSVKLLCPE